MEPARALLGGTRRRGHAARPHWGPVSTISLGFSGALGVGGARIDACGSTIRGSVCRNPRLHRRRLRLRFRQPPPDPGPSAAPSHPAQRPEPPGPQQVLQAQAHENEQQGRWLGAITAWRSLARSTRAGEALYETARQKLFGLAGLSWMAPIKSRESLPLVVGRSVVLVPYKVRNGDTVRHVVTGVSLDNGQVLWTREDAVAFPYKDDPVAFVHNREHVTRIDLKTGGDLWEHRFLGQSPDTGPRQVLGLSGERVIVLGDTWPAALDLQSGRILWGPNPLGRSGYAAFVTEHGVLAWPKGPKPPHVATSEWRNLPVVMLSYEKGEILWQRTLIPGDPWRLVVAGDRMYASDAHLASELPWAAISLKNGQTVWRQPQGEARPSTLVALPNVLVDRPLDERKSRVTYFRDPRHRPRPLAVGSRGHLVRGRSRAGDRCRWQHRGA